MKACLFLAVAVLAACTPSGSPAAVASLESPAATSDTANTADTAPTATETQVLAFAQCMRNEGVDIGDPTIDNDGNVSFGGFSRGNDEDGPPGPPEGFREAIGVCGDLLEGLDLGFGQRNLTEVQDTLLAFAQCMRDNGYDMEDPDLSAFDPGSAEEGEERPRGPFGDLDFEDPVFVEAQKACSDILGSFGGPPGQGQNSGAGSGQDGQDS